MNTKQLLGLAGAALLFVGPFLNALTGLFVSKSLIGQTPLISLLLIGLALASAALAFKQRYRALIATGGAALLLLLLAFAAIKFLLSQQGTLTVQTVSFGVAWWAVALGAALMIAAGLMKSETVERTH